MLDRLSYQIDRVCCFIMVAFLGIMVVTVFFQVVWRYAFAASIFWSEELSRYLMVWATMLAAGVCLRRGMHMSVRFIHDLLPPGLKKWTSLLVYTAILVFLTVVFSYGLIMVSRTWSQISPTLRLPMGLVYLAIPLGALLMFVHDLAILEKIWRDGHLEGPAVDRQSCKTD